MHSPKPEICSALADRSFVFDGGPAWRVEDALDHAALKGVEADVPAERKALLGACRPASPKWLADRLTVLWATYMASRAAADPRAISVWMAETAGLLSDVPFDILAQSIDTAIRKSRHGFIPSVGEIRQFADPLIEQRDVQLFRLSAMEAALSDAGAVEARADRRAVQAAHVAHMAQMDALARQPAGGGQEQRDA